MLESLGLSSRGDISILSEVEIDLIQVRYWLVGELVGEPWERVPLLGTRSEVPRKRARSGGAHSSQPLCVTRTLGHPKGNGAAVIQ